MTEDIRQRLLVKIKGKGGLPTLVYNPKSFVTPYQAARLAQLLPMLFHGPSKDIPWHEVIKEWQVNGHFDVEVVPDPVVEQPPETPTE